ncbi:comF family protein [Arboricoccus pini]|uniref:ComF family protein n=1 Tax=Arboricoccus pini TaxID=1963835 RepID=A0A212QZV6_9PROT|nr:ComF family protein [Arboricoccus pini]SNB65273.1 comF family protein [Arboricoccus pini]
MRFLHSVSTGDEDEALPVNSLNGSRSALIYDEASRHLILGFKHGGRIEGVELFARWMVEAGREILAEADIILPVPLHRWRLLRRGFNQCSLLARRISHFTGVPTEDNILRRTRQTRSQQGLNARARHSNITPATFAISPKRAHLVQNARIVLIDDVLTTGTTLAACAQVLKQHGACSVTALTLARTGYGADMG